MRDLKIALAAILACVLIQPLSANAWVHILAAFNPSPQAWTTTFEADPTNTDSISLADDHMRQIKAEIRDRLETEMDFGSGIGNVTTDTGRLLAGAARVFVQNTAPSVTGAISAVCLAEADRNGNRGCDGGRVWVDPDGADNNAGTTADNYQVYVAVDSDADGDADSWQPLAANTAGGIGGTVPTGGIILWDTSSTCPAGYTEATAFRNHAVRGADIAVADANVPNGAGVSCDGASAPAGCGAAGGTANYNDTQEVGELVAHTHTGPSHTHTATDSGHTHTVSSHTHTMAHTHDTVLGSHTHNWFGARAVPDTVVPSPNVQFVRDANEIGSVTVDLGTSGANIGIDTTDLGTKTSGGSSAANTGSGGSGTTGSGAANITVGAGGTGATGSTGGGQPNLGPFRTVLFCVKT